MANEVELKGRMYVLTHLNLNDLVEIEEQFEGMDIEKALMTMRGTRYVLWLVLRKANPDLKLEDVGNLIDMQNMEKVREILMKLGEEKRPPEKKKKENKKVEK